MLTEKLDVAHGIAVDMIPAGGASNIMIDGVLSGSAEFANPGTLTALQAIRHGADLKIVAAIANNQLTAVINNNVMRKIGVSTTAPIADRIRALKGLTIGVNPVGSNYYQMARSYLAQYGVDPDKDVRLVPIADISAQISGILQGRYDAIIGASGVVEQAIALNVGTLWFSCARGDIPGSQNAIVSLIVASSGTIEKHRDDVDALRAALTDGLNAVLNDHEATGKMLKAAYFAKMDPVVWDLAWSTVKKGYPYSLAFPRSAYDLWIANDPAGAASYKNVDYNKIVYGPAQER
jgi:NitT/TauT family transport system substrate-binding protein